MNNEVSGFWLLVSGLWFLVPTMDQEPLQPGTMEVLR